MKQNSKLVFVKKKKKGSEKETKHERPEEIRISHLHNSHALLPSLLNQRFFVHFLPIKVFQAAEEMPIF